MLLIMVEASHTFMYRATIITKLMIAIISDSNSKSVISASFIIVTEESGSNAS